MNANGSIQDVEGSAEDDPFPWIPRYADVGTEVVPVLVLFEAVAAAVRVHDSAFDTQVRIDGVQVEISPVAVFFMQAERRIPAQADIHRQLGRDLPTVLGEQIHGFAPAIQVNGGCLGGRLNITQQEAGEPESHLVTPGLRGSAGRVRVETQAKRARTRVRIVLHDAEIAAEHERVPAPRPGQVVAIEKRARDVRTLPGIAEIGFPNAIDGVSETDRREVMCAGAAKA